jgi:hypothetical protein
VNLQNAFVVEDTSCPRKRKNYQKKTPSGNSSRRKSHKILMVVDSHVKNCVTKLQHKLGANYEASSFVKPGTRMDTIVNIARDEIQKLRIEDIVVIWGGGNDINNKIPK